MSLDWERSIRGNKDKALALPGPILVIGAAHSGKSELAHSLLRSELPTTVLGTGALSEPGLAERINELKGQRPPHWQSIDVTNNLLEVLERLTNQHNPASPEGTQILIDSVSQWVAAEILTGSQRYDLDQLNSHIQILLDQFYSLVNQSRCANLVMVTSEVGAGVTPPGHVARLFRLATSRANTKIATIARTVVLVSAGIPMLIKTAPPS